MHLTETFASTVALTIPVLILAGAVELRNLSNTTSVQLVRYARKASARIYGFLLTTYGDKGSRPGILRQIALFLVVATPGSLIILILPLIWFAALFYSAVVEILCFIYLAGVSTRSEASLPLNCIISIGILLSLLVVTPMVQTIIIAPEAALHEFDSKIGEDLNARVKRELGSSQAFRQLPKEERKKRIDRVKSIITDSSLDNVASRQGNILIKHSPQMVRHRTQPPRWLTRNRLKTKKRGGLPSNPSLDKRWRGSA